MRITLLPKGRTCQGTRQAHLYRHQYLASGAFPMGGGAETRKAPLNEGASFIELVPYSFTAIRQHHGTRSHRSLPTLNLVHEQAVDDTGAIFEVFNRRAFIDSVEVDWRT